MEHVCLIFGTMKSDALQWIRAIVKGYLPSGEKAKAEANERDAGLRAEGEKEGFQMREMQGLASLGRRRGVCRLKKCKARAKGGRGG